MCFSTLKTAVPTVLMQVPEIICLYFGTTVASKESKAGTSKRWRKT